MSQQVLEQYPLLPAHLCGAHKLLLLRLHARNQLIPLRLQVLHLQRGAQAAVGSAAHPIERVQLCAPNGDCSAVRTQGGGAQLLNRPQTRTHQTAL